MGRSTAATKRAATGAAPNQHNPKHENGLVTPAKKVQKQRSNGHLNGTSKPSDRTFAATPPATPSIPPEYARSGTGPIATPKMVAELGRRSSLNNGTCSESSSSESYNAPPTISISQEEHRQIDVNATKNPNVHRDAGPVNFLVTVLRSCPLWDTIAILIVLLQLPPTFLTIVHFLFASLTFVPPSTSGHSTFSLTDIFEGTIGTPSIHTIVIFDALVLLVWLFLWRPFKDIALDLAQTVIALTLGGGTSSRDAGFNNVLVCLGVIGVSQFARNGSLRKSSLRMFLPAGTSRFLSDDENPLEPPILQSNQGPHAWIRTILAIHILTQGVVRYIRDWYVRRERRDSLLNAAGDPEAAKGTISNNESLTADPTSSSALNVSTPDPDTANGSPFSSSMDKTLTSKKKRKVSAQVRIRQPLWAALASTKIVMAKEYETSRTAAESAGTNATDINNLGNAPFSTEADRIWITYVGFDEVCFNTSFFPAHPRAESAERKDDAPEVPGIDKTKPFFVRVNKSIWQPTRINAMGDTSLPEINWGGEIFGLAPMSSYDCEFVSTADGNVLFSTSVRTLQAPTADISSAPLLSPGVQQSPTTTLRTSIATAELKLAEERNRQKRERKEQKSKMNAARKEIDKLTNSIASSGGNDDRLRQKVQQSNLHAKQADDAAETLADELETIESIPEDDTKSFKRAKLAWQSQKDIHKESHNEFNKVKQASEREVQALTAEVTAFLQKRERMQARINKLNGEHERITDANARGLDEAQRKSSERAAKEADRARTEMMYMERLDTLGPQIQGMQQTLAELWAGIQHMQQAEVQAYQAQLQHSPQGGYDIPEGVQSNAPYPWNPPGFVPNHSSSNLTGLSLKPGHRARGRSSSMLSNVSGFTQSSNEEPPLPRDARELIERERQKSEGSSSASGTSGSAGDPKSPSQGFNSIAGLSISSKRYSGTWDER